MKMPIVSPGGSLRSANVAIKCMYIKTSKVGKQFSLVLHIIEATWKLKRGRQSVGSSAS